MNDSFFKRCFLFLLLSLVLAPNADAKNILKDILKIYTTYQEVNIMMFLAGDVKAEKRFGQEAKWFINLTNKHVKNPQTLRWANSIFNRVKPQFRDRGFDYDLTVLEGGTVNAFAIPGGNIFIYKGMLDFVGSDDELAAVLAHELTHAERRHSLKQLRANAAFQVLLQKAVKSKRDRDTWGQIVGALTMLQFSRQDEDEADDIGQTKMFAAGFNPSGQVVLWEKFTAKFGKGDKGILQYLATHPPSQDRVENARRNLAKFKVPETRSMNLSFNILSDIRENMLQNGSFETGAGSKGMPDNWSFKEGKAVSSDLPSITGRHCLQVIAESNLRPARVFSDFIAVRPDRKLSLTGWVRSESGTQRAGIGAELYDAKKRLHGYIWPVLPQKMVSTSWSKVQCVFEGGKDPARNLWLNTAFMRVILQNGPMSQGSVWFDDLSLVHSDSVTPQNFLTAGDFELAGSGAVQSGVANGLPDGVSEEAPEGVIGSVGRLARDTQRFKTGYSSLRMSGADGQNTEMEFAPIQLADLKEGQELQGTFHYCGSGEIKARCIVELLDEAGNPLTRHLVEKEFTTKPDEWQATGFKAPLNLDAKEKAVARAISVKFIAAIASNQLLWLDGCILR